MKPRPYQQQLIDGSLELWRSLRRIALVLATGGGKTVIFSVIIALCCRSGKPALVLAHRKELIDQAVKKLHDVSPGLRVGVFKGTRKQWRADVVVASVATAKSDAALRLLKAAGFGLIVIDECHHSVADTYVKVLRELGAYAPGGPLVLGVTATLTRADGLALGTVFEGVVEPTIGLRDLIRQGWLVPPRGVRVRIAGLDMSRVRQLSGDLDRAQLAAAMHDALAPTAIARAYLDRAKGRPTLAFLPTVALSKEQAEAFNEQGVRALHVDGTMLDDERDAAIDAFREGQVDVLCNVGLFAEGTDMPWVSCVILGRPTKSPIVYTQQVGRGVRLHPGKTDCIVMDVVGVTGKHRLATLANLDGADRAEELDDELALYEEEWTDEELPPVVDDQRDSAPPDDVPSQGVDGPLEHELVDLFGSAHASWLRTPGGVWFLAAGPDHLVYLDARDDGRYDVRSRHRDGSVMDRAIVVLRDDVEIGYAMAWGEEYVEGRPMWGMGRDAKWRDERPTAKLLAEARWLGLGRTGTRGEVFDRVAVAQAARLLDA